MATLYRKYRSQRFDDVIGQEPIVTTLTNQIKLGRIGHAYLFTGSRGIGKTSCARIFARAVNCLHPVNGSPCGECDVCRALASDNVDIIEMDAASNNGVDDARDIREKVKYLPVACRYKVYIIDEVHMLTGGAFNALLKTIEEPPEHVIFILATTEPQKLPQTILSRCIRFDFRLVPTDVLAKHIARVYDSEGVKYTPDAVDEIARLGEGSVRDALSVADMLCSAAEVITPETVLSLTGAGNSAAIAELFSRTAERDVAGALVCVDGFAKSGKSMSAVCRQLTEYARNVLVVKSVGREKAATGGLVNADRATFDSIASASEKYAMSDIARILEQFSAAESGLKYSVNPRVFLETALIKLICGAEIEDDLRKRVAALERNSGAVASEQKKNKIISDEEKPVKNMIGNASPAPEIPIVRAPELSPEPPQSPAPLKSHGTPDRVETRQPACETDVKNADEGEFLHLRASGVEAYALIGKIASFLRKKGTRETERARELLSRGVTVKERDDAIAFVAPDESFLSMSEASVTDTLNAALDACGIKKRARIEKTEDDLYADDYIRAIELFGRDGVVKLK